MYIDTLFYGNIDYLAIQIRGLAETTLSAMQNTNNAPCHIEDALSVLFELTEKLVDELSQAADESNESTKGTNRNSRNIKNIIDEWKKAIDDSFDMTATEINYLRDNYGEFESLYNAFVFGFAVGKGSDLNG